MHVLCILWTKQTKKIHLHEIMNFPASKLCNLLDTKIKLFFQFMEDRSKQWISSLFVCLCFKPAVHFKILQCKMKQKIWFRNRMEPGYACLAGIPSSTSFGLWLAVVWPPGVPHFCWEFFTFHVAFPNNYFLRSVLTQLLRNARLP